MMVPNFLNIMMHVTHCVVKPFYYLSNLRRPPNVPAIKNSLLNLSACTLARMIRNGEVNSRFRLTFFSEKKMTINIAPV